jgi:hypothetical protein
MVIETQPTGKNNQGGQFSKRHEQENEDVEILDFLI